MYGIGIASQTYDADGAFILSPLADTSIRDMERRLTRTKTLDGGVVITDGGYSVGDRTLDIVVTSERELALSLAALLEDALWVIVSTEEGCYLAKFQELRDRDGKLTIRALIKEDLSQE
jgi:hypothetical protein